MNVGKVVSRVLGRVRRRPSSLNYDAKDHFVYLASYPKSGVTWLQFLLANALANGEDVGWREFGRSVPDAHSDEEIAYMNDPGSVFNRLPVQFVKAHYPYRREFRSAVYLARDGRDAITSYYYFLNDHCQRSVPLGDLIKGRTDFGSWQDHVLGWLNGGCPNLLVVKYEDLRLDTVGTLSRIFSFVGCDVSSEAMERAIAASTFDRMRRAELDSYQQEGRAITGDSLHEGKGLFVRKGKVGDWRNLFREDDVRLFWTHQGRGMRALGYEE